MSLLKNRKRIHFIVPYPFDIAPGQRFRYEQYLTILKESNFDIKIFPFLSEATNKILYKKGNSINKILGVLAGFLKRFYFLPIHFRADFIFLFREATPIGPPVIEWILAVLFRKKIIYDFDDAIWLTDKKQESKFEHIVKCRSKVKKICKWAYKVTCGNDYLVAYARQFNARVVLNPTTIDTINQHNPSLHKKQNNDYITIGWTGSHSTLKYLNLLIPVIENLEKKYPLRFLIIADKKPELNLKSFQFIKWSVSTEIEDLRKIDLGIMPLPDDEWSKGKCGFKLLQYMALRIPALASPVGVNTKIIDNGINGFICADQQEWISRLEELITNHHLRQSMGNQGRHFVERHYSVSSNSSNFLSLFA